MCHSGLRIQCCYCCGAGSIPGPQKRKKKKKIKGEDNGDAEGKEEEEVAAIAGLSSVSWNSEGADFGSRASSFLLKVMTLENKAEFLGNNN